jgi:hypothetical protein
MGQTICPSKKFFTTHHFLVRFYVYITKIISMMKYKPFGRLALLCFFFVASTLTATDYYVNASTGDNANSGLSGSPVKTIQHVMTLVLANDVVYIEAGDYSADSVSITKSLQFELNGTVKIGILRMSKAAVLLSLSGDRKSVV